MENTQTHSQPQRKIFVSSLAYSTVILDELMFSFFPVAHWPVQILQPRSFLENRYSRPRFLLFAICCVSCLYYQSGDFYLNNNGRILGKEFYEISLQLLNEKESELDYICALILLLEFAINTSDARTINDVFNRCNNFYKKHHLHLDPDDPRRIELNNQHPTWTMIQKETFRRCFWMLSWMCLDFEFVTTKYPLNHELWLNLTETFEDQLEPVRNPNEITIYLCQSSQVLSQIRKLNKLAYDSRCKDPNLLINAKQLSEYLTKWGDSISAKFSLVAPTTPHEWFIVYLHAAKHIYLISIYRFLFVDHLHSKKYGLHAVSNRIASSLSSDIFQDVLQQCLKARKSIMVILINQVLPFGLQPYPIKAHIVTIFARTCAFLGILMEITDLSKEIRIEAENDYKLIRLYLKSLEYSFEAAKIFNAQLDQIENLGWGTDPLNLFVNISKLYFVSF
ncbi:hypothetical protein HK096_007875 [Nowakowskiella sp. JEL0078]|nr:hypothetical protein HK096_007875 [Nowakowskiella sp. JEL0078]